MSALKHQIKVSIANIFMFVVLSAAAHAAAPNVQADGYWRCYDGKVVSVTLFGNGPNSASYVFVLDGRMKGPQAAFQINGVVPEVYTSMADLVTNAYIHHQIVSVYFGDKIPDAQPVVQVSLDSNPITNCDYGAPGATNLEARHK